MDLAARSFTQVATLPGSAPSFSATGLNSRTTYGDRVRVHDAAADSPAANTVTVRALR